MEIPAQDRNRTSPFPYGGHRFEFRAVGSAQNVSLVNTVLNTITANAFKEVADRIEGGETAQAVAADLINTHVPKVMRRRLLDELLGQGAMVCIRRAGRVWFGWRGARDSLVDSHRSSSTATTDEANQEMLTKRQGLAHRLGRRRHLSLQRPEEHGPLRGHGRVETQRVRRQTGNSPRPLCRHRRHRGQVHVRRGVASPRRRADAPSTRGAIVDRLASAQGRHDQQARPALGQGRRAAPGPGPPGRADTPGKAIEEIHASSGKPQADLARTLRLETMIDIRAGCDDNSACQACARRTSRTRRGTGIATPCSSSTRPRTS